MPLNCAKKDLMGLVSNFLEILFYFRMRDTNILILIKSNIHKDKVDADKANRTQDH